jgi:hypothetical protein
MFISLSAIFKNCQEIRRKRCKVQCCLYHKTNYALTSAPSVFYDVTFISVLDLHFACICLMFDIGESMISSMIYGTLYLCKSKGKVQPRTGHDGLEGA